MAGEQFGSPAYSGEGKFPMNELANDVSYSELRAELQALRKKLEDLETRQSAIKPGGRGTLRQRFPRTFLVASILLSVLFVGSGLLWGDQAIQALIVDKDGNVRINGVVGIGRAPIADQSLLVTPKVGNIPLNVTNPGNTINWLTVLSDGKVLMNGGGVGIGTSPTEGNKLSVKGDADFSGKVGVGITKPDATLDVGGNLHAAGNVNPSTGSQGAYLGWNALSGGTGETDFINSKGGGPGGFAFMQAGDPRATLMFINGAGRVGIGTSTPDDNAKLDVKGEIRGKPWYSVSYGWLQGQGAKRMTRTDRSVCFLTMVGGNFAGWGEKVWIEGRKDNYWYLTGESGQKDVKASAVCIGAPDGSW